MKVYKRICVLILVALSAIMFTACTTHSNMSFTFNVETGDSIKVSLDTSKGLLLTQEDGKFYVKNGEQELLQGIFLTKENYDYYMNLKDSSAMDVIEEGKGNNNNDYLFYECEGDNGKEYDFLVWVSNSNTGILMGSFIDQQSAKDAFNSITASVE